MIQGMACCRTSGPSKHARSVTPEEEAWWCPWEEPTGGPLQRQRQAIDGASRAAAEDHRGRPREELVEEVRRLQAQLAEALGSGTGRAGGKTAAEIQGAIRGLRTLLSGEHLAAVPGRGFL